MKNGQTGINRLAFLFSIRGGFYFVYSDCLIKFAIENTKSQCVRIEGIKNIGESLLSPKSCAHNIGAYYIVV